MSKTKFYDNLLVFEKNGHIGDIISIESYLNEKFFCSEILISIEDSFESNLIPGYNNWFMCQELNKFLNLKKKEIIYPSVFYDKIINFINYQCSFLCDLSWIFDSCFDFNLFKTDFYFFTISDNFFTREVKKFVFNRYRFILDLEANNFFYNFFFQNIYKNFTLNSISQEPIKYSNNFKDMLLYKSESLTFQFFDDIFYFYVWIYDFYHANSLLKKYIFSKKSLGKKIVPSGETIFGGSYFTGSKKDSMVNLNFNVRLIYLYIFVFNNIV